LAYGGKPNAAAFGARPAAFGAAVMLDFGRCQRRLVAMPLAAYRQTVMRRTDQNPARNRSVA
jgi:hypothetical protein